MKTIGNTLRTLACVICFIFLLSGCSANMPEDDGASQNNEAAVQNEQEQRDAQVKAEKKACSKFMIFTNNYYRDIQSKEKLYDIFDEMCSDPELTCIIEVKYTYKFDIAEFEAAGYDPGSYPKVARLGTKVGKVDFDKLYEWASHDGVISITIDAHLAFDESF